MLQKIKESTFVALILLSALIISGCVSQPKIIDVEIIPDQPEVPSVPAEATANAVKKTTPAKVPAAALTATTSAKQTTQIPSEYSLAMAFAPQAPFANWDAAHEEACEEASMIMVDKYFKQQPLDEQIMEQELQKLLKWEQDRGYEVDLTAQETVDVLRDYFGLSARLSKNATVDQIKYEISRGKPIIIPAAGRELKNPYYKAPGPLYHMLVIRGYDNNEFITNDPGTRRGDGYAYPYGRLLDAIHDWNAVVAQSLTEEDMAKGEKVMVVVDK